MDTATGITDCTIIPHGNRARTAVSKTPRRLTAAPSTILLLRRGATGRAGVAVEDPQAKIVLGFLVVLDLLTANGEAMPSVAYV